jgi:type II secretion system protein I
MKSRPPVEPPRWGIPVSGRRIGGAGGFTLLEVLVAIAILAIMLTSLLGSQLNSIQATRYARDMSIAALLAEWQLVELETQVRKEGFVNSDVEVEGDFAELGWDQFNWACTVHFVELPDYNQMIAAKDDADEAQGKDDDNVVDAGDQMFGALGMVWPIVKNAIESSIRKVTCTVTWKTGNIDYEYDVQTFWTDPAGMLAMPGAGGEFTDADDPSGQEGEDEGGSSTPGGGRGGLPPSRGGTGAPGGGMKGGGKP